jgi:glycosyltransferase involved in cell wall biosynthesis
MPNPKFSIVLPTRNRHQTLQYALKTCLSQDFEDYEIIVSDNFSTSDTQEVVEKFNDDRIVYLRTNQPLAMSKNWEFALSHIRGDYVILIGDDDGLLFNSLSLLDNVIDSTKERVVRWDWILYYWPDFFIKNVSGKMYIPMSNGITKLNSTDIIKKVVNYQLHYNALPMLYNSVVHNSILTKIKEKDGVFFHSQAPDIYSGLIIAKSVNHYLSISTPLSIAGLSKSSNGAAQLYTKENSNIKEDFTNLNEKAGLNWHPKVPAINVLPAIIADSYYHAKDNLFNDEEEAVDYSGLIKNCMQELSNLSQIQEDDLNKVKSKCFKNPELMEIITFKHRQNVMFSKNKLRLKRVISKFFGKYMKYSNLLISDIIEMNLKSLGISNVHEVTEFLNYSHFPDDAEINKTKSEFIGRKIDSIAMYRKFSRLSEEYVKQQSGKPTNQTPSPPL